MQTHELIELVFIVLASMALLTQTAILLAMYLGINKATHALKEEVADLRASVMPTVHNTRDLIDNTRELVERIGPKVEQTVTDVSVLAQRLRSQAAALEEVTAEVLERVRTETGRLDHMFSGTLDAVDKASVFVNQVVSKPVRQISGVLASIKAIVESLTIPQTPYRRPPAHHDPMHDDAMHDDKDMFV